MRHAILCLLLALPSCGLFSPDTKPASDAIIALEQINAARLERELALAERITDEDARAQWVAAFERDAGQVSALHSKMLEWVDAVGQINWKELYESVRIEPRTER